jgi:hypothetical protein
MDVKQVASRLNVSEKTVRRLAAGDASFPVVRIANALRVDPAALETWITRRLSRAARQQQQPAA